MNTLTLTRLSHRVAIYVPGTDGLTTLTSEERIQDGLDYVARRLADWFGGATVTDGSGYYIADNGTLVKEPVKIVHAFCDTLGDDETDKVIDLAHYIKVLFSQECVAVELDGALVLV